MTRLMPEAPFITFMTAAYNAQATLAETMGSLLAQTAGDWEMVLVDDGSADGTLALAERLAADDPRITVLSQPNAGAAAARNRACTVARGRWWCVLDADDQVLPGFVERMSRFIGGHPGYDLYSCGTEMRLPDGGVRLFDDRRRAQHVVSFSLDEMIERNRLHVTTVFAPAVHRLAGGFRNVYAEDYDFWLRALAGGAKHLHDPEVLAVYRVSPGGKNAARDVAAKSVAAILSDLAPTPGLDARTRRLAERMAAYYTASPARWLLEERLRNGDVCDARRTYREVRAAYLSAPKYVVGLAAVTISPRLFARLLSRDHAASSV